jgi:cytosine/uracil/thiamine/allantoin permease
VLSGRIGAMYHVGFPVVGRASFGIWGSLWPVFNRAAMVSHRPPLMDGILSASGLL